MPSIIIAYLSVPGNVVKIMFKLHALITLLPVAAWLQNKYLFVWILICYLCIRLGIMRKNILGCASKREFDTIGLPLNHFKPIAMRIYQFAAVLLLFIVFKIRCKFYLLDEADINVARFPDSDYFYKNLIFIRTFIKDYITIATENNLWLLLISLSRLSQYYPYVRAKRWPVKPLHVTKRRLGHFKTR